MVLVYLSLVVSFCTEFKCSSVYKSSVKVQSLAGGGWEPARERGRDEANCKLI